MIDSELIRGAKAAAVPARGRPLDVLVVGDDAATLRGLELGLGHFGHLIYSVPCLSSAVAHLSCFVIDVLICDVRLVGDAGRRVVRAARAGNHDARAFGLTDDPVALLCSDAPTAFDRLFLKPVDCVELHRTILAGIARG